MAKKRRSAKKKLHSKFQHEISPQLQPSENDNISWNTSKHTNSKESSGYGSGTSESDPENEQQTKKVISFFPFALSNISRILFLLYINYKTINEQAKIFKIMQTLNLGKVKVDIN